MFYTSTFLWREGGGDDGQRERGEPLASIPSTQEIALPAPCIRAVGAPALPECLTQRLECQIRMQRLLLTRVEGDKRGGDVSQGVFKIKSSGFNPPCSAGVPEAGLVFPVPCTCPRATQNQLLMSPNQQPSTVNCCCKAAQQQGCETVSL